VLPVAPGFPAAKRLSSTHIYGFSIERSPISPHLPLQITFKAKKELIENALYNENLLKEPVFEIGREKYTQLLKRYTNGFLGGAYSVISRTNYAGLELPSEVELKRYSPEIMNAATFGLLEIYHLKAETISKPKLESGKGSVLDCMTFSLIDKSNGVVRIWAKKGEIMKSRTDPFLTPFRSFDPACCIMGKCYPVTLK
jgi:hypothetical protein